MAEVAVHKYAGILSAYGMACADVVYEEQEPSSLVYEPSMVNAFLSKKKMFISLCLDFMV